jgi:type VI secretion system protein ImpM
MPDITMTPASDLPGYFGKIPMRGDFVTCRLPRSFLDPWDSWLQEAICANRERMGNSWLSAYLTRALLQTSEPEKNGGDGDHSEIVGGLLFVSCGNPAELFQPVDQPLNAVPLPIGFAIEIRLPRFIGFGRNDGSNTTPT